MREGEISLACGQTDYFRVWKYDAICFNFSFHFSLSCLAWPGGDWRLILNGPSHCSC